MTNENQNKQRGGRVGTDKLVLLISLTFCGCGWKEKNDIYVRSYKKKENW